MALPKLNERLIKKVLEHIKKFPGSYEQNISSKQCGVTKKTPCGAIGCFGGWAILLSHPKFERFKLAAAVSLDEAQELLGLTEDEANFLFDLSSTYNPKKNYQLIQRRLTHIRESRAKAIAIAKLETTKLTHEDEFEEPLVYGEREL